MGDDLQSDTKWNRSKEEVNKLHYGEDVKIYFTYNYIVIILFPIKLENRSVSRTNTKLTYHVEDSVVVP